MVLVRKACRSVGLSTYRLWKVTRGAVAAEEGAAHSGLRATLGSGGAGVVTQCDVSAPSARYAPAPPSVAARTRPPNVAPYAPPPSAHLFHTGF